MKEIKIEVPEGYEIDKENSTFEKIIFKEKRTELPMKYEHINGITGFLSNIAGEIYPVTANQYGIMYPRAAWPTIELAKAAAALSQLLQLRDRWNGDWKREYGGFTAVIINKREEIVKEELQSYNAPLVFKSKELRDKFLETFRDLIEIAKPLL